MKLKLAILPLCLIAVMDAFGFEGTVKQTVRNYNGTGTDIQMNWYISSHGCRIDMSASGKDAKGGTSVLLFDPSSRMLRTYDVTGGKTYYEAPSSAISGTPLDVSVTTTAETKKIQGYNCEKWTVTAAGASYDIWITRDIDFNAAAYSDFFKASIEVQALAKQGVKGFALLTESRSGSNASAVEQVTPQAISAETFAIPAGFTLYSPPSAAPAKAGK